MRVVHVTDCYLPRVGGIELHVRDLVAQQRARGLRAEVWTTTPAPVEEAEVRRVPPGARLTRWLRRELERSRPDVLHVHCSVVSPLATLAAREAAAADIATVVTVHSMWTGLGPLPATATALLGAPRWPVVWSAVSRSAARALGDALGPGADVHVLSNAVDVARWRTDPADQPDPPPRGALEVVSVLRFARTKRPLPLLRILAAAREQLDDGLAVRATLVGDGPLRARARRWVVQHGLDGWVDLPGQCDRPRIREHLAGAAVYLAPATLESFGLAALEARCAGVPVLARSGTGVEDFVVHGESGLIASSDAEMAAQLVRVLGDPDLRARIARHNHTHAPSYDWDRAHTATLELYGLARHRAAAVPTRLLAHPVR